MKNLETAMTLLTTISYPMNLSHVTEVDINFVSACKLHRESGGHMCQVMEAYATIVISRKGKWMGFGH